MISFLLFIGVTNLGLGYYLGAMLLRPSPRWELALIAGQASAGATNPLTRIHDVLEAPAVVLAGEGVEQAALTSTETTAAAPKLAPEDPDTAPQLAERAAAKGWNAPCLDIRQDIAKLRDRSHYVAQANDKKITQELAFEMQCRAPAWQQFLHDKLTALMRKLEGDPTTKADCVAPELCLAQIETFQTNLQLLDWSDASESILKKIEREIEAVKNSLPAVM